MPALFAVVSGVTAVVLVIVLGAFLVAQPEVYRRGVRVLIPKQHEAVFDEACAALFLSPSAREKDGNLVAQCPGRDQEQVRMVQAPAKRLHHVSFTLRPGTLDSVCEALERAGTPVIAPPAGAIPRTVLPGARP